MPAIRISYDRKICEYVFAKEDIKLIAQTQESDPKKLKRKEESIVTVKSEGKSFVLKRKVKDEVNIE